MNNRETIKKQCIEWARDHLGQDFKFRPNQLETIVETVYNVVSPNVKCQMVEAPTGSGKSNIAIVSCGVLWQYYQKRSYILASDLGLIDQYAKDFERYNLNWGVIKGSENYMCTRNNFSFKFGECKMKNVPYKVLMNQDAAINAGYDCACTCDYIMKRKLAITAPVTLMTYAFWLLQRNSVASIYIQQGRTNEIPFDERDFIVCDECHKLGEIVQEQYSPKIDQENNEKLLEMIEFAGANGINSKATLIEFNNKAFDIFASKTNEDCLNALREYQKLTQDLSNVNGLLLGMCEKNPGLFDDKDTKKVLFAGDFISQLNSSLIDYIDLIEYIGEHCLVKNCENSEKIKMNCIYEDFLVKKYFHDKCNNELLLSATIGNSEMFASNIGMHRVDCTSYAKEKYKAYKIPSTFDFSKSPIYYLPTYKMNMKEKDQNLPIVSNIIYKLFERHKGQKGIVQTGSFAFSNYLFENAPRSLKNRMLIYNDSKIKGSVIEDYKNSEDSILIGPSLTTGISLDGDLCRFLIVMKIPYLNLGDKLVAAKMHNSQLWYSNQTVINLTQGFGRGVRYNGDWCISYILDGCFTDLLRYNKHLFDKEILDRIVYLQ